MSRQRRIAVEMVMPARGEEAVARTGKEEMLVMEDVVLLSGDPARDPHTCGRYH